MDLSNVTMFVMGLDPTLGCKISQHVTGIVNNDRDIIDYRESLHDLHYPSLEVLYSIECQWFREKSLNRSLTRKIGPSPDLSITVSDIYLDLQSDSDTVRMTEELIRSNLDNIISVCLWDLEYSLSSVLQYLPQCTKLLTLRMRYMYTSEDGEMLISVLPRLTKLNALCYNTAVRCDAVVYSVLQIKHLKHLLLYGVGLDDYAVRSISRLRQLE